MNAAFFAMFRNITFHQSKNVFSATVVVILEKTKELQLITNFHKTTIVIGCALMTASCATGPDGRQQDLSQTLKNTFASDDPCSNNARNIGVVGGAIVGALIGKQAGSSKSSLAIGAGLGALLGGFIGSDIDRRRCELAKVAKLHNLDIVMTDIKLSAPDSEHPEAPILPGQSMQSTATSALPATTDDKKSKTVGMSFTVFDHGDQFSTGSATPSENAQKAFADIADKYASMVAGNDAAAMQAVRERNRKMRILLIGHTDDTGPSKLNADLSEERARAIARIFSQHGFDAGQIYYQGAGEVFPIADNNTEVGRARNRRVEIVDLSDEASFQSFLASRRPNVTNYRPVSSENMIVQSTVTQPKRDRPTSVHNTAQAKRNSTQSPSEIAATKQTDSTDRSVLLAKSSATVTSPLDGLDFGGKPIQGQSKTVDIGKSLHSSSFSIISPAYASGDETPIGSCTTDRPRISNRVKLLSSGADIRTADYLPGTAGSSWGGKANGHLVGLADVAVLRDGGQPARNPTFYIWKNWIDGSKASPDLKTSATVNTYLGDKALLYRVFPDKGPVRCIDVRIPSGAPSTAPASTIVYQHMNSLYQADYSPTITR